MALLMFRGTLGVATPGGTDAKFRITELSVNTAGLAAGSTATACNASSKASSIIFIASG